jgi:hypothetical protein
MIDNFSIRLFLNAS